MMLFLKIFIILISLCPSEIFGVVKTCSTWKGYLTNKDCEKNTDDTLDVPGQINKWGFKVDTFKVFTEDQYVLTAFRANPTTSNGKVILLMHGIAMNSQSYTNRGNKSLVYQLVKSGYTVWSANFRGTKFSHKNATDYNNPKYFEFSFHEMGIYDLPALLEFGAKNTPNFTKFYYIGFSMGTTASFVLNTEKPEIANKYVKVFINIAPIAFLSHIKTPLRFLAPLWKPIAPLVSKLTGGQIMKPSAQSEAITRKFCLQTGFTIRACNAQRFIIFGVDFEQQDPMHLPVCLLQNADSIPVQVLTHFIQILMSGKFRYYDYGKIKNLKIYGSVDPPEYDLSKVSVKQKSFVGRNDYLSDMKDALKLHSLFPKGISDGIIELPYKKWNHADFIMAKDSVPMFTDQLIEYLNNFKQ